MNKSSLDVGIKLKKGKKWDKARKVLEPFFDDPKVGFHVRYHLSEIYMKLMQFDKALAAIDLALELRPHSNTARYRRMMLQARTEGASAAHQYFKPYFRDDLPQKYRYDFGVLAALAGEREDAARVLGDDSDLDLEFLLRFDRRAAQQGESLVSANGSLDWALYQFALSQIRGGAPSLTAMLRYRPQVVSSLERAAPLAPALAELYGYAALHHGTIEQFEGVLATKGVRTVPRITPVLQFLSAAMLFRRGEIGKALEGFSRTSECAIDPHAFAHFQSWGAVSVRQLAGAPGHKPTPFANEEHFSLDGDNPGWPADRPVILVGVNEIYFRRFHFYYLQSLSLCQGSSDTFPTVHFHVVDATPTFDPHMVRRKFPNLTINFSFSVCPYTNRRPYYAIVRYFAAQWLATRYTGSILVTDIDGLFRRTLPDFFRKFIDADVAIKSEFFSGRMTQSEVLFLPWKLVNANFLFIGQSATARRFLYQLVGFLSEVYQPDAPKQWWIDQSALFSLISFHNSNRSAIKFKFLRKTFLENPFDDTFEAGASKEIYLQTRIAEQAGAGCISPNYVLFSNTSTSDQSRMRRVVVATSATPPEGWDADGDDEIELFRSVLRQLSQRFSWFKLGTPSGSMHNVELFLIFRHMAELRPRVVFESGAGAGRCTAIVAAAIDALKLETTVICASWPDVHPQVEEIAREFRQVAVHQRGGEVLADELAAGDEPTLCIIDGPKPTGEIYNDPAAWHQLMTKLANHRGVDAIFQHDCRRKWANANYREWLRFYADHLCAEFVHLEMPEQFLAAWTPRLFPVPPTSARKGDINRLVGTGVGNLVGALRDRGGGSFVARPWMYAVPSQPAGEIAR